MIRNIVVNCPYCGETAIINIGSDVPECTLFKCQVCENYYVALTKVTATATVRKIEGFGEGEADGE